MHKFLKTIPGRYAQMTFGCLIYAVGISLFLNPNRLAAGGVVGTAIIINSLTGFHTGLLTLLINIPLLILGTWKFGFKFFFSTIYATVLSSVIIDLISPIGALSADPLLAGLAGAVLVAVGMGLIFRAGGTTGGSDILVRLLKLKLKHVKTGALFLMTDALVVLASALVFGQIDLTLYTIITIVCSSLVMDKVLYGVDGAKMIHIISDHADSITARLLLELEIGVTCVPSVGAFTGAHKNMLLTAVRKQLLPPVQEIVREEDRDAFMIVTSANEIFGEGFKNPFEERI